MSRDISQFIANLNSLEPIESSFTGSNNNNSSQGQKSHDDELSIFSNTQFFDFDMGRSTNIAVTVDDLLMQQEKQLQNPKAKPHPDEGHEYHHQHDYNNGNSHQSTSTSQSSSSSSSSMMPQFDFGPFQQFSLANELPPHRSPALSTGNTPNNVSEETSPTVSTASGTPVGETSSKKRKTTVVASSVVATSPLDDGRLLGEDEKRRRNTAASARFRIKKKLREQEMERNARELQEKVQTLETKLMQLEMENRWLKNLVVEKNEARDVNDLLNMRNRILGVKDENVDVSKR
jgi:hypothetical protein